MDKFSGKNVSTMKSGSWSLLMRSFRALIVFDIAHQVAVASTKYSLFPRRVQNVAIIGGGAAGLITAKVFQQTGFNITIFEQTGYFGGVWQYGIQSNPMYRTLRTNLPTEIMSVSYEDPFILSKNDVARSCDNDDLTSYASHDEVMLYLKNFADKYSLHKHVQFNSTVVKVERSTNSWTLYHQRSPGSRDECNGVESAIVATEFDAVIVCNGHFSKPFIPTAVQGLAGYTGLSMHSIRYDSLKEDPSLLAGKKVLVVGGKSSATDMAREILLSGVAAEVRISDRNIDTSYGIMYSDGAAISVDAAGRLPRDVHAYVFHPSIRFITEGSRTVTFADGSSADIDMILWCTGYLYDYPFLHNTQQCGDVCIGNEKEEKEGDEEDNGGAAEAVGIHLEAGKRLRGLHLKMIHQEEPTMAFIGLPFSVVPFPLFYFQARLLAALYKVLRFVYLFSKMKFG